MPHQWTRENCSRRSFLAGVAGTVGAFAAVGSTHTPAKEQDRPASKVKDDRPSLDGVIGLTTGSLSHQRTARTMDVFSLPKFVRDELGMRLIDLNTRWLAAYDERYIRRVNDSAEKHGCYFTNLKVNHQFGDLYHKDSNERTRAMSHARELILAANKLGARWIRFSAPKPAADGPSATLAAHHELAKFAEQHRVQLLIENNGWMRSDAGSVARLVKIIGHNVAPQPDTGNWNDDVRYAGIAASFPGAASCDFKVFDLDERRQHEKYDIKRCFDIACKSGFRGPWALEHWNTDTRKFAAEIRFLRDQLASWIKVASGRR